MRYQRYLNEKFYGGVKATFGTSYEIFKNPSRKELKEIPTDNGYRFVIDFKKKDIYITSDDVFHFNMIDNASLGRELKFTIDQYWSGESDVIAYIFMGDCDKHMNNLNSDAIAEVANGRYKAIPLLIALRQHNMTWLSKYGFNPKDITGLIDRAIKRLENLRGNK